MEDEGAWVDGRELRALLLHCQHSGRGRRCFAFAADSQCLSSCAGLNFHWIEVETWRMMVFLGSFRGEGAGSQG